MTVLTRAECREWAQKYGSVPFNSLALATAADKAPSAMQVMRSLFVHIGDMEDAISHAAYHLHPNQGEPPDPSLASMWLRTTFPPDHPNYIDRSMIWEFERK